MSEKISLDSSGCKIKNQIGEDSLSRSSPFLSFLNSKIAIAC